MIAFNTVLRGWQTRATVSSSRPPPCHPLFAPLSPAKHVKARFEPFDANFSRSATTAKAASSRANPSASVSGAMPHERRGAQRATGTEEEEEGHGNPSLSLNTSVRARGLQDGLTGMGSPITPGTTLSFSRKSSYNQNINTSSTSHTPPAQTPSHNKRFSFARSRIQALEDDDASMRNRLSMDSTASTVTNSTITGDGHVFEGAGVHPWTEEQQAVITRTVEDGHPPPKEFFKPTRNPHAHHQLNPNSNSQFKFLANWNPAAPPPPTTPYLLPNIPGNLLEKWARDLKKHADWPHDTRSIRTQLRNTALEIAREEGHTRSPNKRPSNDHLSGDDHDELTLAAFPSREENSDSDEDDSRVMAMDYERQQKGVDNFIISPTLEGPPFSSRKDEAVLKSSMRLQNDLDSRVDYQPYLNVRSVDFNRPRSPRPLHSPSPPRSMSRGATISPTASNFSFNDGNDRNSVSPTKFTFGITPEKSKDGYLSTGRASANRSRSISPSSGRGSVARIVRPPDTPSPNKMAKGKGVNKPLPALLQTPSLSPMKLSSSPRLDQASLSSATGSASVFESGSVQRRPVSPQDELLLGNDLRPFQLGKVKSTAKRAPIPAPFFPGGSQQSSPKKMGRGLKLNSEEDPFTDGLAREATEPTASLSSASGAPFSTVSSISSMFSNGSMRRIVGSFSSHKNGSQDTVNSSATGSQTNLPLGSSSGTAQPAPAPNTQPLAPYVPGGPHSVQEKNKRLMSIPFLAALNNPLTESHPHLVEASNTVGHGRGGIKRSASFSKPMDFIKRAPTYNGPQPERAPSRTEEQPPQPQQKAGARPRHKRERSDSTFDGSASGYDTEDVPPSSAPSSDRVPQHSPLKPPPEMFSSDSSPSPTKEASGRKGLMRSSSRILTSPGMILRRLQGKSKDKSRDAEETNSGYDASVSPSPAPTSPQVVFPDDDDSMDIDMEVTQTPAVPRSPEDSKMSISPMGGITPRQRVASTPRPMTRKMSREWSALSPEPEDGRHASAELRSIRGSPIDERPELVERSRKRVKTDELQTPPRQLRGGPLGYNTRPSPSMSPRAMSDGGARRFYKRGGPSRTPPRKSAPRSPRLLPGGGRATPSDGGGRRRYRSTATDDLPAIPSLAQEYVEMTPEAPSKPRAASLINDITPTATRRGTRSTATAATLSSASKAVRRPGIEAVTKQATSGSRSKAGPPRTGMKREPSYLGGELVLKQEVSGSARFPTATTASISSVLFPGGIPPQSNSTGPSDAAFEGIGSGEEGVIRAGESAASARRGGGDSVGKSRVAIRNSLGGSGRSRMTRSISMLGPQDRPHYF